MLGTALPHLGRNCLLGLPGKPGGKMIKEFIENVDFEISGKRIPCLLFIGIQLLVIVVCYSFYVSSHGNTIKGMELVKTAEERIFEAKYLLLENEYVLNKDTKLSEETDRIVVGCHNRMKEQEKTIISLKRENKKLKDKIHRLTNKH